MELGYDKASAFIDFHFLESTLDYTTRMTESSAATITFTGKTAAGADKSVSIYAGSYNNNSSKHVKENIKDITDEEALKILQLRPVSFDYKYTDDNNQRGLIAEEVLEILPNMVNIPDGYTEFDTDNPTCVPSIDYSKFVPYLIKMIQIQQKEIEDLKK